LSHPHRIWWMQTFQDMMNNEGNNQQNTISPDNLYIQSSPSAIRGIFEVPIYDNNDNYIYNN